MRGLRARDENQALPLRQNLGFQAVFNFDRETEFFFRIWGRFGAYMARFGPLSRDTGRFGEFIPQ